jgi:hypothetical protein
MTKWSYSSTSSQRITRDRCRASSARSHSESFSEIIGCPKSVILVSGWLLCLLGAYLPIPAVGVPGSPQEEPVGATSRDQCHRVRHRHLGTLRWRFLSGCFICCLVDCHFARSSSVLRQDKCQERGMISSTVPHTRPTAPYWAGHPFGSSLVSATVGPAPRSLS